MNWEKEYQKFCREYEKRRRRAFKTLKRIISQPPKRKKCCKAYIEARDNQYWLNVLMPGKVGRSLCDYYHCHSKKWKYCPECGKILSTIAPNTPKKRKE